MIPNQDPKRRVQIVTHKCTIVVAYTAHSPMIWKRKKSKARFIIGPLRCATLPCREDRLHFYLHSRMRRGNAPYCEPSLTPHAIVQSSFAANLNCIGQKTTKYILDLKPVCYVDRIPFLLLRTRLTYW